MLSTRRRYERMVKRICSSTDLKSRSGGTDGPAGLGTAHPEFVVHPRQHRSEQNAQLRSGCCLGRQSSDSGRKTTRLNGSSCIASGLGCPIG